MQTVLVVVTATPSPALVPTLTPPPTQVSASTRTPTVTPIPRVDQLPFDQARALATNISYDDLFRNNETHVGKLVGFAGKP
jgi:hypothetical protein